MYFLKENMKKALLVQPNFPLPNGKSKNHKKYHPIGLLKISSYLKEKGFETELVFYQNEETNEEKRPDIIFVTSVFTYWSSFVKEACFYFKEKYPDIPIVVGGIYATLMPEHCREYTKCDYVVKGPVKRADELGPDESLFSIDFQILHTSRGCPRKCKYCGVKIIEPESQYKFSIKNEVHKKKIVFYDNNLLANPYIEHILDELIELRQTGKINYVESQSGVDGRIIRKKPYLAFKLFKAGFKSVKIAWDGPYKQYKSIERQIIILTEAGFKRNELGVFMIYNAHLSYEEMEKKRIKCAEWQVQIIGCRYVPLNQTFDNYNPKKEQTNEDYYISEEFGWTDQKNKKFKRNIRYTNAVNRYNLGFYSKSLSKTKKKSNLTKEEARSQVEDFWDPFEFHNFDEEEK